MKILLDTHILLWALAGKLPPKAIPYIRDSRYTHFFSPISIMEIVIKNRKGRPDFQMDAAFIYNELLKVGYIELPVTSHHALMVGSLPLIHKDPLDRLLLAQAQSEGIPFLTYDKEIAKYPGYIVYVG